jgi:hypothetical protein
MAPGGSHGRLFPEVIMSTDPVRKSHRRPPSPPTRRLQLKAGDFPARERPEAWLLLAVVTASSPPAVSAVVHGTIAMIGNTVETVPASNPNATNAPNGVGSLLDESDFLPMAHVAVDRNGTTFDSRSAALNRPAGSTVLGGLPNDVTAVPRTPRLGT